MDSLPSELTAFAALPTTVFTPDRQAAMIEIPPGFGLVVLARGTLPRQAAIHTGGGNWLVACANVSPDGARFPIVAVVVKEVSMPDWLTMSPATVERIIDGCEAAAARLSVKQAKGAAA